MEDCKIIENMSDMDEERNKVKLVDYKKLTNHVKTAEKNQIYYIYQNPSLAQTITQSHNML